MFKETQDIFEQNGLDNTDLKINGKNLSATINSVTSNNNGQALPALPAIVCLSHLRWDFVYQRPQHLLSRFASCGRVYFVEEPEFGDHPEPWLSVSLREAGVRVVVPQLAHGMEAEEVEAAQRNLLNNFFQEQSIERYLFWYYTPMALGFTSHFRPLITVYDCMDELSAFRFAPPRLRELEQELFRRADLVFTGGHRLYEAKKEQHPSVHAFPSSIDKVHFAQARKALPDPADQAHIPQPRLGFCGVIDERMDLKLLEAVAKARPEWQLVMIGPVVKIDPATLPQAPNIHYLGGKSYKELPAYLSNWQVALLPFALNESTEFISPTKTPEYLAAGLPVVSTPICDVVRPYGQKELVHIAATPADFINAIEKALAQQEDREWLARVDAFMAPMSWQQTWQGMAALMVSALHRRHALHHKG